MPSDDSFGYALMIIGAIIVIALGFWMFFAVQNWFYEQNRIHKKSLRLWAPWEWFR